MFSTLWFYLIIFIVITSFFLKESNAFKDPNYNYQPIHNKNRLSRIKRFLMALCEPYEQIEEELVYEYDYEEEHPIWIEIKKQIEKIHRYIRKKIQKYVWDNIQLYVWDNIYEYIQIPIKNFLSTVIFKPRKEMIKDYRLNILNYKMEIGDIEDFAYYGSNYPTNGMNKLLWFFNIKQINCDFLENPLTYIDGPLLADRSDWGWEYYKFLLTGKFCDDCLHNIEEIIEGDEQIKIAKTKIETLQNRHIRQPVDNTILLYKFEKALKKNNRLLFWEF